VDPTLFRARVTGPAVEDTSDTTSPAGERQALIPIVIEDSDVTGSTAVTTIAKGVLADAVPCPAYAANLFYWQTINGPGSSVPRAQQPLIIVRKDATVDAGTTACYTTQINPPFVAQCEGTPRGSTTGIVYPGNFCGLTFRDQTGTLHNGMLGYVGNQHNTALWSFATGAIAEAAYPTGLVLCTARWSATGIPTSFPGGYTWAWMVTPIHGPMTPCIVTAGSGASYSVNFWPAGQTQGALDSGTAVAMQYDPSFNLPAGTVAWAMRTGGSWWMQPQVWL
jgi:hypothetical protein